MKKGFYMLFLSAAFMVTGMSEGWAAQAQNTAPHRVTLSHPIHGTISVPVHKSDVGVRHPESNVKKGVGASCGNYSGCHHGST